MQSVIGIVITIVAAVAVVRSLPRAGRTAWYVGSRWEGYIAVTILGAFGLGIVLTISGLIA